MLWELESIVLHQGNVYQSSVNVYGRTVDKKHRHHHKLTTCNGYTKTANCVVSTGKISMIIHFTIL